MSATNNCNFYLILLFGLSCFLLWQDTHSMDPEKQIKKYLIIGATGVACILGGYVIYNDIRYMMAYNALQNAKNERERNIDSSCNNMKFQNPSAEWYLENLQQVHILTKEVNERQHAAYIHKLMNLYKKGQN